MSYVGKSGLQNCRLLCKTHIRIQSLIHPFLHETLSSYSKLKNIYQVKPLLDELTLYYRNEFLTSKIQGQVKI